MSQLSVSQFLFGYDDGHRLISGSRDLSDRQSWELVRLTDRPKVPKDVLQDGVIFGFQYSDREYLICKIWLAERSSRAGSVWSHVIIVESQSAVNPMDFVSALHPSVTPDFEKFSEAPWVEPPSELPGELPCSDSWALLLSIASKPRSELVVRSEVPMQRLLLELRYIWPNLFSGRAFSSHQFIRGVCSDRAPIIIINHHEHDFLNNEMEINLGFLDELPSERISFIWRRFVSKPSLLLSWLNECSADLRTDASNLKLVFELLLIGSGKLDDYKLLDRVYRATSGSVDSFIFHWISGVSEIPGIQSPSESILHAYLLSRPSTCEWHEAVSPERAARLMLDEPLYLLGEAIQAGGETKFKYDLIRELSQIVSRDWLVSFYSKNEPAAEMLVQANPALLFHLPHTNTSTKALAVRLAGQAHSEPKKVFRLLEKAPSFWRGLFFDVIKMVSGERELLEYAIGMMESGDWEELPLPLREKFFHIDNFPSKALNLSFHKKILFTLRERIGDKRLAFEIARISQKLPKSSYERLVEEIIDAFDDDIVVDVIRAASSEIFKLLLVEKFFVTLESDAKPLFVRRVLDEKIITKKSLKKSSNAGLVGLIKKAPKNDIGGA